MTAGRDRFSTFSEVELRGAAETFARYRIAPLAALRKTDRESRSMFVRDLREGERRTFPQMQLILQLLGHFHPLHVRNRPNSKDPSFEEVVIPARLANFSVDFHGLTGLLKPNQDMANAISLELARGRAKVPSFTPFIVPKISEPPWPIASAEHSAAVAKWKSNTRVAKRELFPEALPLQAWLLYQLRFLITAELLGALATFGGLPASLAHLAIVLNLATTDSVAVAMVYDRLVKQHLEEKARARAETTLGEGYFSSFLATENAAFRLQATAECIPRPTVPKSTPTRQPAAAEPSAPTRQPYRRFRTQPAASSPQREQRRRSPAARGRSRKRSRTPPRKTSKKRQPPPMKQQRKR